MEESTTLTLVQNKIKLNKSSLIHYNVHAAGIIAAIELTVGKNS